MTLSIKYTFDHESSITSLLKVNENCLASGSENDTIKIWSFIDGQLVHTLQGHNGSVLALEAIDGKSLIASGSFDRTIKIWNINSGSLVHTFEKHTDKVNVLLLIGL